MDQDNSTSRPPSARLPPQHLIPILIFSDSKKDWLPGTIIPTFNLADRQRFEPVDQQ
jgi:hypothetical protein